MVKNPSNASPLNGYPEEEEKEIPTS